MIELDASKNVLEIVKEELAYEISHTSCPDVDTNCHEKQKGCNDCCINCLAYNRHPKKNCTEEMLCDGVAKALRERGVL